MSLKCGYSHTHISKKAESVKMSDWTEVYSEEEEERMVAQVGGRVRSLVQAVRKVQRERESREGPSKFTGSPGCTTKTTKAGGRSTTWPGSRRKTRGTTDLG